MPGLIDFVEQGHPPQGLSPAERSLVPMAMQACFTAFNPGAMRQLITTALEQGVDEAALLQAIQLGAHLSVHGAALGANVNRSMALPARNAARAMSSGIMGVFLQWEVSYKLAGRIDGSTISGDAFRLFAAAFGVPWGRKSGV